MVPFIGPIIEGVVSIVDNWQKRKKVVAEGKVKIAQAKVDGEVKRLQTQAESDAEYNVVAAEGMKSSWKDEFWSLVFGGILICSFLPWTQPYVKEGFIFMKENTPYWFEYSIMGMIAASFGLKGWNMWKKP